MKSITRLAPLVALTLGVFGCSGRAPDTLDEHASIQSEALWSSFEALGGAVYSGIAVTTWGPDRLDVFYRGADSTLRHRYYAGGWSGEENLGGTITSAPAAVAWSSGRIDIVARGADGTLVHKWYQGGWSGWESLGGAILADTAPAITTWGTNRLDIFYTGNDHAPRHKAYANAWLPEETLDGYLSSGPGAVAWAPGRIDIFARGGDGALWHKWYEGGWGGWESLGGQIVGEPAVSSWGSARLDMFYRGTDNALKHRFYAGGWGGEENLGGVITSPPGAVSWGTHRIDVLVRGGDNGLYRTSWTDSMTLAGGPPPEVTPIVLTPPPTAYGVTAPRANDCAGTAVSTGLELANRECNTTFAAAGCSSTYERSCETDDLELFTGVSLGQSSGPTEIYSGYGGRGEQMAKAGLCLLRDLRNGDVRSDLPLALGASAYQRVGFTEYDPSAHRVRGYRQLGIQLPLVGSVNLRAQAFSAELADWSHPYDDHVRHMLGSFPVTRGHALLMAMDDNHEQLDMTLAKVRIDTPYGPIMVQPEVHYTSDAKVVEFPGSSTPVKTRVLDDRATATTDVYGRFQGAKTLDGLPAFDYLGRAWTSQVGMGSRSYTPAWDPATVTRPDRDPPGPKGTTPRNALEQKPGAEIRGGVYVAYSPDEILPAALRTSPLKVTAKVWVKPEVVASVHGELGVFFGEVSQNSDGPRTRELLSMQSDLFGSARVEFSYGFDLDVWVHVGWPIGDLQIVNLHPHDSVPIPLAEAPAARHAAEVLMTDAQTGPSTRRSSWSYDRFTTMRGEPVADGKAWVDACLASPPETQPLPAATYTPGNPQDLLGGEFPCNICVGNPSWSGDVDGTYTTVPPSSERIYSSTAPPSWTCAQYSLGCMDVCTWNPVTNVKTVTRSQVSGDRFCARPR